MAEVRRSDPILFVAFYRTAAEHEPVRRWLLGLKLEDRKAIGRRLETVQYGWPLGMPLVRKLGPGLWEVRSCVADGIVRVIFTVVGDKMVLLHGFIKKSDRTPAKELATARRRLSDLGEGWRYEEHPHRK